MKKKNCLLKLFVLLSLVFINFQFVQVSASTEGYVYSNKIISISTNNAYIMFDTSVPAICDLTYIQAGLAVHNALSAGESVSSGDNKNHGNPISNLATNTKYYYQIQCEDFNGNSFSTQPLNDSGLDPNGNPLPSFKTDNYPGALENTIYFNEVQGSTVNAIHLRYQTNVSATCTITYNRAGLSFNNSITAEESYSMDNNKGHGHYIYDLLVNTKYYYQIKCKDVNGKAFQTHPLNSSGLDPFGEPLPSFKTDNHPNVIEGKINSLELADISPNSAFIMYNTNVPATCTLRYNRDGMPPINAFTVEESVSSGDNKNHGHSIANLFDNTNYYYQILCTDGNGNPFATHSLTISGFDPFGNPLPSFMTESYPGEEQGIIYSHETAGATTDTAYINYKTNVPAKCTVSYNHAGGRIQDIVNAGQSDSSSDNKSHKHYFSNLSPNTKYFYYISCEDRNGNFFETSPLNSSGFDSNGNPLPSFQAKTENQSPKPEPASEKLVIKKDDHITIINKTARQLHEGKIDSLLLEINELRSQLREQETQIRYLKGLTQELSRVSSEMRSAINTFITYGVDDNTRRLGKGERAAVVNSFKTAYGNLPNSEEELSDVIKIANGRWPSQINIAAENRAKEEFKNIYKREANMNNPLDNAAVTIMAYGLRQKAENRNLNSEAAGLRTFRNIYNRLPQSTEDWNILQAITYSGASR